MEFQVVCISRTIAAGGEAIGRTVAQRLGFRYVDEEVITTAARKAQVDPQVVAAAEHKQPFIKRLIAAIGVAQGVADPLGFPTGVPIETMYYQPIPNPLAVLPEDHRTLIRTAIHEIATEGKAVIVAHAASMALAGVAGVLRVLVTASPEIRARRLAEVEKALDKNAVATAIKQSDTERRDYFRRFYNIKEELPTHYDLVVNTDVLTLEQAVDLICAARG